MQYIEIKEEMADWADCDQRLKVLLVAINISGYYSLPVRILSLMSHADHEINSSYDVRYIEWDVGDPIEKWGDYVNHLKPDIIGLSMNIWNRNRCFQLIDAVKNVCPHTCFVAGGQEVTKSVEDYLSLVPRLDYIIDGEGEISFKQFLKSWNQESKQSAHPEKVSGLRYRKNGKTVYTGPAETVASLDEIPSAVLAGLVPVREKNRLGVLLEGARGCPFRCAFCFEGAKKEKVRYMSVSRLSQEIEYMAAKGANYFHMMDPILCNGRSNRLRKVSDIFAATSKKYGDTKVSVEAYGEFITKEVAQDLNQFSMVDIGLQTTNPESVKAINRSFSSKKFSEGIAHLRSTQATTNIYLIPGLPFDSLPTTLKSIEFTLAHNPTRMFINELLLLNGTELRYRASEYGYQFNPQPPYRAYSNKWMTSKEMNFVHRLAKYIEKRYNLSFQSRLRNVPWLPKSYTASKPAIVLNLDGGCQLGCLDCMIKDEAAYDMQSLSKVLDDAVNRDIRLRVGDRTPLNKLCQLGAQFQLAGANRIQLSAPLSFFLNSDGIEKMVRSGIWHFKTFVHLNANARAQAEIENKLNKVLVPFCNTYYFKGQSSVKPFIELVVFTKDVEFDQIVKFISTYRSDLSGLHLPWLDCWSDEHSENMISSIIELKDAYGWLHLPVKVMQEIIKDFPEQDEIFKYLTSWELLSDLKGLPPCHHE